MTLGDQGVGLGIAKTEGRLKKFSGNLGSGISALFGKASDALSGVTAVAGPAVIALGAVTAAATAAGYAAYRILAPSFEQIDKNAKLADSLGITYQSTQKLGLAAELSGANIETLSKAMLNMGRNIGSGGKPLDQRFLEIADQIAAIRDPGKRAAEAVRIFGKQGLELLPTLLAGKHGILESAKAIDRFGLALDRTDAKKVEEANDSLTVLGTVLRGVVDKTAVELAPVITALVDKTLDLFEKWGAAFKQMGVDWDFVGDVFVATGAVIASVMDAIDAEIRRTVATTKALYNAFMLMQNLKGLDFEAAEQNKAAIFAAKADWDKATVDLAKVFGGESARSFIDSATKLRTARGDGGGAFGGAGLGGLGMGTSGANTAILRGSSEALALALENKSNPLSALTDAQKEQIALLKPIREDIRALAKHRGEAWKLAKF